MIQKAIHELVENKNLDFETTKEVMDEIMSGNATQAQISSFLTALRMKGETGAMCGDFYAACAGGMCDGLKVAREQGYCGAGSVSDSPETGTLERTR